MEKEHVAVCLQIQIGLGIGVERYGYLILDPGYHVSRVVTIMEDKLYPHTGKAYYVKEANNVSVTKCVVILTYRICFLYLGCFVQEDNGKKKKEYDYIMANSDYIAWNVTETKAGYHSGWTNLIYVGQPYVSGVDFAERRNLLYDFKSILQRDCKGRLLAGMYFSTNPVRVIHNCLITLWDLLIITNC